MIRIEQLQSSNIRTRINFWKIMKHERDNGCPWSVLPSSFMSATIPYTVSTSVLWLYWQTTYAKSAYFQSTLQVITSTGVSLWVYRVDGSYEELNLLSESIKQNLSLLLGCVGGRAPRTILRESVSFTLNYGRGNCYGNSKSTCDT